jgi:hypothetical protein
MQPRQDWGFLVLVAAVFAVGLTLGVVLPALWRTLRRHPDVLIPLGLYVPATVLVRGLATVPALAAVLSPIRTAMLFSIAVPLSLAIAADVFLAVVYTGWTTVLVLQAVRKDRVDATAAFANIGRWFFRVFGALFIGWSVLSLAGVAIALGTASPGLSLLVIGAASLAWNLASAALLLVVVGEDASFPVALRRGVEQSWTHVRHWWLPVVAQMILLGWVTFIHVKFSTSSSSGSPLTIHIHTQEKTKWGVNGFWTGGYQDDCRWYADLMKAVEAEPLPLVTTLLALLFAVLAIAVKVRIAAEIYLAPAASRDTTDETSSDPQAVTNGKSVPA